MLKDNAKPSCGPYCPGRNAKSQVFQKSSPQCLWTHSPHDSGKPAFAIMSKRPTALRSVSQNKGLLSGLLRLPFPTVVTRRFACKPRMEEGTKCYRGRFVLASEVFHECKPTSCNSSGVSLQLRRFYPGEGSNSSGWQIWGKLTVQLCPSSSVSYL